MNDDVKVIILRVNRGENKPTADTDLFGHTLEQWVRGAMRGITTESVDYTEGEELLPVVTSSLSDAHPITAVFYSDTPLLTYTVVSDAVARLKRDNMNIMRLPRGWVFRTDYARSCEKITADRITTLGDDDFLTIANYNQLAYASEILRSRITYFFMERGVEIVDPNSTFIGADVVIEAGAKICPFCRISGKTIIRKGATIGENCVIDSSVIEGGAIVKASTLSGAIVYKNASVGPYAHLRKGSVICVGAKIGDYVEIKNSRIGAGSKINHLAYVGDAEIGKNCNIGAGVVFANYDGKTKRRITLGDKVFVGSNSTLIAPLDIGKEAFIGAGSVITQSVPAKALAIGRSHQTTKENWENNTYTETTDDINIKEKENERTW